MRVSNNNKLRGFMIEWQRNRVEDVRIVKKAG